MKAKYLIIAIFALLSTAVFAQEENDGGLGEQTLIIYNEYTPVLKDANRIQFLPVIVDTIKINPDFGYNVQPTLYRITSYNVCYTKLLRLQAPISTVNNTSRINRFRRLNMIKPPGTNLTDQ